MDNSSKQASINQEAWNNLYRDQSLTGTAVRSVPDINGKAPEIIEKGSNLLLPNSNILEIGCGHGTNLLELAKTHNCTGLDISKEALITGRKRAKEAGVKINYVESDFYRLPFEDSQFDCIIALYCLQFNTWKTAVNVFEEINRVLRNNGILIFKVRSTSRDMPKQYKILEDFGLTFKSFEDHEYGMTYHHYSEKEIDILTKGFDKVELYELTKNYAEENGKRVWWVGTYRKPANSKV